MKQGKANEAKGILDLGAHVSECPDCDPCGKAKSILREWEDDTERD